LNAQGKTNFYGQPLTRNWLIN